MKTLSLLGLVFLLCLTAYSSGQVIDRSYAPPIILSPDSINSTSFVLRWQGISGNGSGILCDIAFDSNFTRINTRNLFISEFPPCVSVSINRFRVKVPSTGTFYYRIRQGVVSSGSSMLPPTVTTDYSSTAQVTTLVLVQPVPASIYPIQNITHNGFQVLWHRALGFITNYRLETAADSNFTQNVVSRRINPVDTSAFVTNLLSGTTYFVRVIADGYGAVASTIVKEQTLTRQRSFFTENTDSYFTYLRLFIPLAQKRHLWYRRDVPLTLNSVELILDTLSQRGIRVDTAWLQIRKDCRSDTTVSSMLMIKLQDSNLTIPNFSYDSDRQWSYCGCNINRRYIFTARTDVLVENPVESFNISPNPTTDAVSISVTLPSSLPLRISVFDALGQEVRTVSEGFFRAGQNTLSFSMEGLPSGIYFVRCSVGGQVFVRRLAVVR